jgi:hypothetical protein
MIKRRMAERSGQTPGRDSSKPALSSERCTDGLPHRIGYFHPWVLFKRKGAEHAVDETGPD